VIDKFKDAISLSPYVDNLLLFNKEKNEWNTLFRAYTCGKFGRYDFQGDKNLEGGGLYFM